MQPMDSLFSAAQLVGFGLHCPCLASQPLPNRFAGQGSVLLRRTVPSHYNWFMAILNISSALRCN